MKRTADTELDAEIRDLRDLLSSRLPARDCLGRRIAQARLDELTMLCRYETELWGCER